MENGNSPLTQDKHMIFIARSRAVIGKTVDATKSLVGANLQVAQAYRFQHGTHLADLNDAVTIYCPINSAHAIAAKQNAYSAGNILKIVLRRNVGTQPFRDFYVKVRGFVGAIEDGFHGFFLVVGSGILA